jgi:DNA-directed RNA polymerase subunit L
MQVKEISNTKDSFGSTCLKIEISGKNVCYQIVNAIRKVCINQIPIYAFHPDKINITRNSSVYDNSEMTCHLSQLPITKFNHQIKFLPLKYYKEVNFADNKIDRHPDDIFQISYLLKAKNNGPNPILDVTTNDLSINITALSSENLPKSILEIISNDPIPPKEKYSEKYPILLIKLRPGEEFECSMKGVLAIGELNGIFNASNTYYTELQPDKFILSVESSGQLNEYEILIRACEIIIEKLKYTKENLNNEQYIKIQTKNSMIIEILNEDHTCGGPIGWALQNIKNVSFAGVNKPDFMQKVIDIVVQTDESTKPLDQINIAIDTTIEIFNEYLEKFTELYKGKKTSTEKSKSKKIKFVKEK